MRPGRGWMKDEGAADPPGFEVLELSGDLVGLHEIVPDPQRSAPVFGGRIGESREKGLIGRALGLLGASGSDRHGGQDEGDGNEGRGTAVHHDSGLSFSVGNGALKSRGTGTQSQGKRERRSAKPAVDLEKRRVAVKKDGGEGGIRTRGPGLSQGKRLAGVPDRPLQHLSVGREPGYSSMSRGPKPTGGTGGPSSKGPPEGTAPLPRSPSESRRQHGPHL